MAVPDIKFTSRSARISKPDIEFSTCRRQKASMPDNFLISEGDRAMRLNSSTGISSHL